MKINEHRLLVMPESDLFYECSPPTIDGYSLAINAELLEKWPNQRSE